MSGTTKTPIPPSVLDQPLSSLLDVTWNEWQQRIVLADLDVEAIENCAIQLLTHAADLGLKTTQDFIEHSGQIVRHVAAVTSLNQFAGGADAHRVHLARNVLHSLVGAACLSEGECPLSAFEVLPTVGIRDPREDRVLTDDEMLAARTVVQAALDKGGGRLRAAASFCLTEIAMTTGEASHTSPDHFDDPRDPSTVTALGAGHLAKPRTLEVTAHARHGLARVNDHALRRRGGDVTSIAYGGGEPGGSGKASASVCGSVKRVLTDAGLKDPGISAGSVRAWRVAKVLDVGRVRAAVEVSGCPGALSVCALVGQDLNDLVAPRQIRSGY